jgi:hypothetical protein
MSRSLLSKFLKCNYLSKDVLRLSESIEVKFDSFNKKKKMTREGLHEKRTLDSTQCSSSLENNNRTSRVEK